MYKKETLECLMKIKDSQKPDLYECIHCKLRQYHYTSNLNSDRTPGCKCLGENHEALFARSFAERFQKVGRSLYSQPPIFIDGKKHSFDFVLMPDETACCREDQFADKDAHYIFFEILDGNHKSKQERIDKDVAVFGQVMKDYPNCSVIYIDSFVGTTDQITSVLFAINNACSKRVSRRLFGKEKYTTLFDRIKDEYRKIKNINNTSNE